MREPENVESRRAKNSSQDLQSISHDYYFNLWTSVVPKSYSIHQISNIFKNLKVLFGIPKYSNYEIFSKPFSKFVVSIEFPIFSTSRVCLVTNKRVEFCTFVQGKGLSVDFKIMNHACATEIMKFLKRQLKRNFVR